MPSAPDIKRMFRSDIRCSARVGPSSRLKTNFKSLSRRRGSRTSNHDVVKPVLSGTSEHANLMLSMCMQYVCRPKFCPAAHLSIVYVYSLCPLIQKYLEDNVFQSIGRHISLLGPLSYDVNSAANPNKSTMVTQCKG